MDDTKCQLSSTKGYRVPEDGAENMTQRDRRAVRNA